MDKNHKILHLEIYGSYELFSCLMASGSFKLFFFFLVCHARFRTVLLQYEVERQRNKSKEGKRLQGTIIH